MSVNYSVRSLKDFFSLHTHKQKSYVECLKYFRHSLCDFIGNGNSMCGVRKLKIYSLIPPDLIKCSNTLNRF